MRFVSAVTERTEALMFGTPEQHMEIQAQGSIVRADVLRVYRQISDSWTGWTVGLRVSIRATREAAD